MNSCNYLNIVLLVSATFLIIANAFLFFELHKIRAEMQAVLESWREDYAKTATESRPIGATQSRDCS